MDRIARTPAAARPTSSRQPLAPALDGVDDEQEVVEQELQEVQLGFFIRTQRNPKGETVPALDVHPEDIADAVFLKVSGQVTEEQAVELAQEYAQAFGFNGKLSHGLYADSQTGWATVSRLRTGMPVSALDALVAKQAKAVRGIAAGGSQRR